jgi:hypothetical protein
VTATRIDRAQFEALFDQFERSAWRWECQPVYHEPDERTPLAAFLRGDADWSWAQDWFDWLQEITAAGRSVGRVRVLHQPRPDYQRFLLAMTPHSVAAGEDIRLLPADAADGLDLPAEDFWLFDDRLVVVLHLGDAGVDHAEVIADPSTVERYRAAQQRAVRAATPYREWAARAG